MKQFRKVIFWCHLLAGTFAGVVVLVMSVTGVLLTYERQMLAWADARGLQVAPPAAGEAARLPAETLVSAARASKPGAAPSALTVRADPLAPASVGFGREGSVLVDPYTGEALGEGATRLRAFFRVVTDWHRWLGAGGEHRALARAVTGACNLTFLFLVVSGFYLWFPRVWTRRQLRQAAWFRRGLGGRARDFNWHNVVGFWMAVPLFVVVLSAVPISYTWASNLVYRIAGETPPAPRGGGQSQGQPAGGGQTPAPPPSLAGLDPLLARAPTERARARPLRMSSSGGL